jgi:UDP-N-acetylmuramoyl-tripeptide--D-alanyl-D-alanine ligase
MTGVVLGVTGSVGKTGTKEALALALERRHRGKVHRSLKSYNNHTGVPLSLARMPRDSVYGVFGDGHEPFGRDPGVDCPRPPACGADHRCRTCAHREPGSMEAIADAKAEIFEGLEPGGTAIIPNDTPIATGCSRLLGVMPRPSAPSARAMPM